MKMRRLSSLVLLLTLLIAAPETMSFGPLVLILLAAAILVSTAGSALSLRRFLRV